MGASGNSWTSIGMRSHHPMQTDTALQMMNSAVPATIQSAVEKRRKASVKGGGRPSSSSSSCSMNDPLLCAQFGGAPSVHARQIVSQRLLTECDAASLQLQSRRGYSDTFPAGSKHRAISGSAE